MKDRYSTNVEAAAYLARMDDTDWIDDRPTDAELAMDEWQDGAAWEGDPWTFDVECPQCGTVYVNVDPCPGCESFDQIPAGEVG